VKIVLGALIVFLSAAASVRAEDHRLEVSGGYAYLSDQTNAKNVPRGWTGGIGAAITSSLAIAGEVGPVIFQLSTRQRALRPSIRFSPGPGM
jgi:hypothetical protein